MKISATYLLSASLSLATLVACAQQNNPPLLPYPHKVTDQVYDLTKNAESEGISLDFIDPEECAESNKLAAQLHQKNPAKFPLRTVKIPPGGYLEVIWVRKTVAEAAADKFEFIVTAPDGKLICRWKPDSIGLEQGFVAGQRGQSISIPLPKRLPQYTRVAVIEAAVGKKFMYSILPYKGASGTVKDIKP